MLIADGVADVVSLARPFLADSQFVAKSFQGKADSINTCIACNQACLDLVFQNKKASCLVNPQACNETTITLAPATLVKNLAVIGAGPAGLAFAVSASGRGHHVTVFEASNQIGGQFNFAKQIPGKDEFNETLRYFNYQIKQLNITLKLNTKADVTSLNNYDECIVATGILPRMPKIEGIEHAKVLTYLDVLQSHKNVGQKVAIIGAGGIGFDVAQYLSHGENEDFYSTWGIDVDMEHRGGLKVAQVVPAMREIYLLQRKNERIGKRLGKTTGWIHRQSLKKKGVKNIAGVSYQKIDEQGLHIEVDGKQQLLEVDNVIICAGQESNRSLVSQLEQADITHHVIGGAFEARELDARYAIDQAFRLADQI